MGTWVRDVWTDSLSFLLLLLGVTTTYHDPYYVSIIIYLSHLSKLGTKATSNTERVLKSSKDSEFGINCVNQHTLLSVGDTELFSIL